MDTIAKFKRKFWIKAIVFGFVICIYMSVILVLTNYVAGEKYFNLWFFVSLCIAIILFIPLFVTKLYLPKAKVIKEYEQLEKSFENEGDDLIISVFGEKVFQKLYVEDLNWTPVEGIDICMDLLSKKEAKNNDELRFYVYVRMAKFYLKDGSYSKSVEYLKKSLAIKPNILIPNFRIAEILERLGSGPQAIAYYEAAANSPEISSGSLAGYVISQINRIKTKGPRVKKAPSGLKWLTG